MQGKAIFAAFFLLFTLASLSVPVPLFPGNMVQTWFNIPTPAYAPLINSITNGVVYGLVVWLVFVLVTRKLEEPRVVIAKGKKTRSKKRNLTRRVG